MHFACGIRNYPTRGLSASVPLVVCQPAGLQHFVRANRSQARSPPTGLQQSYLTTMTSCAASGTGVSHAPLLLTVAANPDIFELRPHRFTRMQL